MSGCWSHLVRGSVDSLGSLGMAANLLCFFLQFSVETYVSTNINISLIVRRTGQWRWRPYLTSSSSSSSGYFITHKGQCQEWLKSTQLRINEPDFDAAETGIVSSWGLDLRRPAGLVLLENKLQIHMYDNEETNYFRLYMINNGAYIWMYIISSLHVWFCRKAEIFPYTRIKLRNRKGTDGGLVALS